jgi:glycine cleavage system H lipoate-binding protein
LTFAAVVTSFAVISAGDVAHGETTSAGTAVGWGDDRWGQALPPAGLTDIADIAAGGFHTLALTDDGTVVAWGNDKEGQTSVPAGLTGVAQVAAGKVHSLALKDDGTVVAWGDGKYGQTNVPAGLTGVSQVAGGGLHSLALKADGTVVAWGDNTYGQTNVPTGLTTVTQVAAGGLHSLALEADGTVVAWGDNSYGQSDVPPGLTNVTQVAAGAAYSLALKANGTVVAWGDDTYGQANVPTGLTNVAQVAAGATHSVALKADGTVVSWPEDSYGGTTMPAGLNGVTQVSAGTRHSLALVVDRSVVSFAKQRRTTAENVGVARLVVNRSDVTDTEATVHYARTDGTATPGKDFTLDPGVIRFAAGQTSATIPVPITNDRRPEAAETIIVTLSDPGVGSSTGSPATVTLTIAASDQRPDALISTQPRTGYIGNNIYNDTAAGQTKTKSAPRNTTRTCYVRIYNDGNTADTFTLHGSAASRGSSARFFDTGLGFDITKAMRSNAGSTVQLPAGDYMPITVRVTVARSAQIGTIKSVTVTGSWAGDRNRIDAVRASVRVVRR